MSLCDTYLLNGRLNDVTSHQHCVFLTKTKRASNRLVFHGRIPLWLNNEYAISNCEIEATRSLALRSSKFYDLTRLLQCLWS